ncbi:PCI domain-containing protein [Teratosphaeria nubilosa]|uniref:COP9 signalosome complex subunit 4 n=1 Tax=Teratosphaeria nubilosa TaxID=161662 RepID=A0A6G1L9E3_9PEZI|nr:PCI domain-containing protein [Teratosphaeria nubilosa]
MASAEITEQLSQATSVSDASPRTNAFHSILASILSEPANLAPNLVAYVQALLSDSIGVIHSRPLLQHFVEQFKSITDNDVKTEAGTAIVQLLQPRIVSYEQQDSALKYTLADAYEAEEDWTSSAKTLQTITLESSQRTVTDETKSQVWMRICRCYIEDEDHTNALTYLNRVKQVIFNVTSHETRLQFALSQARIYDSQRNFLDASSAYHTLSNESAVAEEERLQALSAAITCAVLAPAGPMRGRQLGRLYKDERANDTPEHGILEKIFLDRLLSPEEVAAFASGLQEHQKAKTSDGSTVLDKAVLEHNLLAVSRIYQNISFAALGQLLGVDADRAELYASNMIESNRLSGSIDQIANILYFNTKEGGSDAAAMNLRAWDANVQGLSEEVEKVTTLLSRETPAHYEKIMVA